MHREDALGLLKEYTTKEQLIKHALAVEASMRFYARKWGEDEESWGVVGLLHDFDYERFPTPETHPYEGAKILRERGFPEEWIQAILSHAEYTGVPRDTLLAKTLFAVDELSGFIVAVALVRPSKKIEDVSVKSVKKKMKDKSFAAAVDREAIEKGVQDLGIPMEEHVQNVIDALKEASDSLGI
ncbi:MAG TPA: HDIG domain-containing protein [Thermotogota bacterium]|nr:HDIG domain-containing protein [Thermotogota bacterium]HRW91834.1 HDIG domain-containing protein [Thermotogota bacterium]